MVTGDAVELLPADASLIYLFNPFGAPAMESLRQRVAALPHLGDRPMLVYYICKHVDVFGGDGRFEVEHVQLDAPACAPLSDLAIVMRR
jgi:hypothetical protein